MILLASRIKLMKSKEAKIIIRGDSDPEILKWVNTLKYGAFPKIMIEILRWYNRNGLLVRGGANAPDLLPPKIPLNQESIDSRMLSEILEIVKDNHRILQSGTSVPPTEIQEQSFSNQSNSFQEDDGAESNSDLRPEPVIESQDDSAQIPVMSNFKIYK